MVFARAKKAGGDPIATLHREPSSIANQEQRHVSHHL
jgi:hypothetical protein